MLLLAFLLTAMVFAAGAVSYFYIQRYGDLRAREREISPDAARSGPADDGGATAYDRQIFWNVLKGKYATEDAESMKIGRLARGWAIGAIVLMVLTVIAINLA